MRKNKWIIPLLCSAALVGMTAGCHRVSNPVNPGNAGEVGRDTDNSGEKNGKSSVLNDEQIKTIKDASPTVSYTLVDVSYKKKDTDTSFSEVDCTTIFFDGSGVEVEGKDVGVTQKDGRTIVTITKKGDYLIAGECTNGQIRVEAGEDKDVRLILNGLCLTCSDSAVIYEKQCNKLVITSVKNTVNTLSNTAEPVYEEAEKEQPDACIFAGDSLSFNGEGTLNITSEFGNGVHSTDRIKLVSGKINVTAKGYGIKGKESVAAEQAEIEIVSAGDGIKTSITAEETAEKLAKKQAEAETEEKEKSITDFGYIVIAGGSVKITSEKDCLSAEGNIQITGGKLELVSGGGSGKATMKQDDFGGFRGGNGFGNMERFGGRNTDSGRQATQNEAKETSAKAIKSEMQIYIDNADITIDSADDAVHAAGGVLLEGGTMDIMSGDDGIHSDTALVINDGRITIAKSYEGLEALTIAVNGGDISVYANDDGLNASAGNNGKSGNAGGVDRSEKSTVDGSGKKGKNGNTDASDETGNGKGIFGGRGNFDGMGGFGGAGNPFAVTDGAKIYINGGRLYVNAAGDGIDSNGDLYMTGGDVLVDGPESGANGALDHNGEAYIFGGTIVAAGSSQMIENFENGSTQNVLLVYMDSTLAAGSEIRVTDENGSEIVSFTNAKKIQCAVISSPLLVTGKTYGVLVNDKELTRLTITATITANKSSGNSFGGGGFDSKDFAPGEGGFNPQDFMPGGGGFDRKNFNPGNGNDEKKTPQPKNNGTQRDA